MISFRSSVRNNDYYSKKAVIVSKKFVSSRTHVYRIGLSLSSMISELRPIYIYKPIISRLASAFTSVPEFTVLHLHKSHQIKWIKKRIISTNNDSYFVSPTTFSPTYQKLIRRRVNDADERNRIFLSVENLIIPPPSIEKNQR